MIKTYPNQICSQHNTDRTYRCFTNANRHHVDNMFLSHSSAFLAQHAHQSSLYYMMKGHTHA
jgi:hypothetical protein